MSANHTDTRAPRGSAGFKLVEVVNSERIRMGAAAKPLQSRSTTLTGQSLSKAPWSGVVPGEIAP